MSKIVETPVCNIRAGGSHLSDARHRLQASRDRRSGRIGPRHRRRHHRHSLPSQPEEISDHFRPLNSGGDRGRIRRDYKAKANGGSLQFKNLTTTTQDIEHRGGKGVRGDKNKILVGNFSIVNKNALKP